MFRLTSSVTTGESPRKLSFDYVNQVIVTSRMDRLTDTCSITLPRNLNLADKNIRELILQGDPVKVDMGYDDDNRTVFTGFVKDIKPGAPVVIECEDAMYRLKRISVSNKNYPSFVLGDFLKEYMPSDIETHIADLSLGEYRIEKEPSLTQVLSKLGDEWGLQFFFREGKFYGVLPTTLAMIAGVTTHKLKFGWNIISDSLEYKLADDVKLTVKAKAILKDNTKLEVTEPKGETAGETEGTILTYFSDKATTEPELRIFAKEMLKKNKVNSMSGSLTIFGLPYILIGDKAMLLDDKNKERNEKTFLVKSVKRTFGTGGYRQEIELGEQADGD